MKLHHWLAVSLTLVCAQGLFAQADRPLDEMPLEVRTAAQLSDVQRQEVHQYINGWVKLLADNSNPRQQREARQKLTAGANAIGTETSSADYQNEYGGTVNDALLPLTKNANMRTRLLAGIVAGRVAARMSNTQLEPMAVALLQDKSDAVVLWGMRTGRYVLPWILLNPMQSSKLPEAMVTALRDHPGVPVAFDAYSGAALPMTAGNGPLLAAAQQTLHLLQARIEVYRKTCPVDPSADSTGTTFLSIGAWSILPADQRFEAVQEISDLLSVMAQRCATDGSNHMARILSGLQPVAAAIYVIGNSEQAPAVVSAAKPVAQQRFQPQTPPQEILGLVAKIYPALVAVPDFAKLKAPPKLEAAPTSSPTSQP